MRRFPITTTALCLLLVCCWAGSQWAGGSTSPAVLVALGARRPTMGFPEPPWRLGASMLLHYGFGHLFGNLLALITVGVVLEPMVGPLQLLLLFFTTGYGGNLISSLVSPNWTSVGASGGVYGLLGALTVLIARGAGKLDRRVRQATLAVLVAAMCMGALPRLEGMVMDIWAHIGGAVLGCLYATFLPLDEAGLARRGWLVPLTMVMVLAVATWLRGPALL